MSQTCNTCKLDQPEENYYLKNDIQLFKKCKSCIRAAKKREKKPRGFAALAPEVQEEIKKQVADRRQKLTDIAHEHDISYANLTYWVRMGLIK
jgi:hypothetical protein